MNQMQKMLMEANRLQKQMEKAQAALAEKEFTAKKAGIAEVVVKGSKQVVSIAIEPEALSPENAEMIADAIIMALNEANGKIDEESAAIEAQLTGGRGFPF